MYACISGDFTVNYLVNNALVFTNMCMLFLRSLSECLFFETSVNDPWPSSHSRHGKIFTQPHAVPNPYDFYVKQKEKPYRKYCKVSIHVHYCLKQKTKQKTDDRIVILRGNILLNV